MRQFLMKILKWDFKNVSLQWSAIMFFQGNGFKLLNGDFARSLEIPLGHHAICEMLLKRIIEEIKK